MSKQVAVKNLNISKAVRSESNLLHRVFEASQSNALVILRLALGLSSSLTFRCTSAES